ncbi:thioredoxin family protein [Aquimarina celericrescens]|uniref:Thioredoxin family protein n=1 Tax=Aquimarina celericrescens TaxID=1964542 RepID=A0ABW5AY97_9FLAO|nr:thioredoxin family protein [Aquimarina celericrescens]
MKKIYIIFIALSLNACISASISVNNSPAVEKSPNEVSEQDKNTPSSQSKPEILVGKQDRKALEQEPYDTWFNKHYENYTVDTETVTKISPYLKDVSIKAFMGTWCGDSKRETPTFYKILDAAEFDYENLELITVTRAKNTPDGLEKGLDIVRVPTFIFYKDGKEIGRYVEFAQETLEKDILAIVSGQPYKHSYED